jgi:hypothetical protein
MCPHGFLRAAGAYEQVAWRAGANDEAHTRQGASQMRSDGRTEQENNAADAAEDIVHKINDKATSSLLLRQSHSHAIISAQASLQPICVRA